MFFLGHVKKVAMVMLGWQGYLFHLQAETVDSFRGYEWPLLWPGGVAATVLCLLVRSVRQCRLTLGAP